MPSDMSSFHGEDRAWWAIAGVEVCESVYAPGLSLERHDHEQAFWCLTLAGGYTEHVGRRRREATTGHLAWHPPGEHHHLSFVDADTIAINVELSGAWLERIDEIGLRPDQPRDLGTTGVRLIQELADEFRQRDGDSMLVAEGLVAELLAETVNFGETIPWGDTPNWLLAARDFIRAHHREPLRLNDIARAVDIHPVHLARRYRQFSGRPVGEHLRQLRVNTARTLLRDFERPLAEIAADCGFADQAHFGRVFRRFTGTTPARFRATAR